MSIGFPTYTVIQIIAVMIAVGVSSWFVLSQGLGLLPAAPQVKRTWRWGAAIVLILWLLAALVLAVNPPGGAALAAPYTITLLALGLLAGILPLLISPFFRQIVHAVPETWLVGIHAIRLYGYIFLALLDMKLLSAEFALPAGYGDMLVGLLALGMVYLLAKRKPYARPLVIGWNVLGLLDFLIALVTGFSTVGSFSAQIAASGVSPRYLSYVGIIPSFGVPLYVLLHIYSLFQMVSARADKTA